MTVSLILLIFPEFSFCHTFESSLTFFFGKLQTCSFSYPSLLPPATLTSLDSPHVSHPGQKDYSLGFDSEHFIMVKKLLKLRNYLILVHTLTRDAGGYFPVLVARNTKSGIFPSLFTRTIKISALGLGFSGLSD